MITDQYTVFQKPLPECALSDLERGIVYAWDSMDKFSRADSEYWRIHNDLTRLMREHERRTGRQVLLGDINAFRTVHGVSR